MQWSSIDRKNWWDFSLGDLATNAVGGMSSIGGAGSAHRIPIVKRGVLAGTEA